MKAMIPIIISFLLLYMLACDDSHSSTTANRSTPVPNATPRLAPGPHIDHIVGFDALDSQQTALAESLQGRALAAGVKTIRVQLDWTELEPQPGIYDLAVLMETLDVATSSQLSAFVTLTTLDTGELTLPVDLMAADAQTPAAGLTLDGPEIRNRFRALMDWLVPMLAANHVWGLSIANEPSTNFDNISQQSITNFLIASTNYTRSLDKDLAVTMTIGSIEGATQERFVRALVPHLDVTMFNYYCLDPTTLTASAEAKWRTDIDTIIAWSSDRDVFFQELGCPTGYSDLGGSEPPPPETLGSSAEIQHAFFQFMIDQILERDELRGASIFQLFDWSPKLAQTFTESLLNDDDPTTQLVRAALKEWLMTVGMCRWSDGGCRAAWNVYLNGVSRAASIRASTTN